MKSALRERMLAAIDYNPYKLITKYLIREGKNVIVDKSQVKSPRFFITLNSDYGWDYSVDYERLSLYFEPVPRNRNLIIGGLYDIVSRKKLTEKNIAARVGQHPPRRAYIYPDNEFNLMLEKISKT